MEDSQFSRRTVVELEEKLVKLVTNDPSHCACYGPCDCSQGDGQTNCQRFEKVTAAMHVLANTTVNVI